MVKVTVLVSLYRCINFIEPFLRHAVNTNGLKYIEFLLLHNDPLQDEILIINKYLPRFHNIKHVLIKEREGLYATWNRGIRLAQGTYITIWNVDDIRFPDSICHQAKALDQNPAAGIAYGDIYGSNEYGKFGDKLYNYPEWDVYRKEFYRSYMMSCFQMWRKSIHQSIGYYDEQFRCVSDFDFQIRTAMHFPFVKVRQPLGIYLEDMPHKISSNHSQRLENNIVYLRYGVFEKVYLHLLQKSLSNFKKGHFLFYGQWVKNREKSPFSFLYHLKGLMISLLKMPVHLMKMSLKKIRK
jgi:glycosyltransferase involved in cell wall biosynthesis